MTVSTELSHEEYTGNGVTTDFDFRFRIFEAKHLVVSVADPGGSERILTNGTDYTLRGVGSYRGGKVILKMPLATGWKIGIARDLPAVQETDLRNQGKFFAEVHEDAFDYLTMLIQKSLGYLSLCLRKPSFISDHYDAKGNKISNLGKPVKDGDAVDLATMNEHISAKDKRSLRVADKDIPVLPSAVNRANKLLSFDDNGNPVVIVPESGSAADVLTELGKPSGADLIGYGKAPYVNRNLSDIIGDIPTNKYFGAKCDGVTDDTEANQEALDWSAENKRTVIFVGKSCISSRLVLNSGTRMENLGVISPINFTDSVVIEIKDNKWRDPYNDGITAIQTGNRVVVNNLYIEPDTPVSAVGIYGTDGVGVVINNPRIFNMLNGGVDVEKGYEWKFTNLSVVAPESLAGTSGARGILHRTSDSMYMNTTVVGYPVGVEVTSGANDIVNTHVWGLSGDRSTRVMLTGLILGGSSNSVINFYSDSPHKLDKTQPASKDNGGIGYNITGYNNNIISPRVLFHADDGKKYGKAFIITGNGNNIKEAVCSDVSGIEDNGVYIFSGDGTPVNNFVAGGNLQSFYVYPQSIGFNPTINAPCTYTSQVYRHELTQRSVNGRLSISCNITGNTGGLAFSIDLPDYLSSFRGSCSGSIIPILNNTIRADTNLIDVKGYVTGGKIFFRRIFRQGSPVDVLVSDLITGNAVVDISFSCQL